MEKGFYLSRRHYLGLAASSVAYSKVASARSGLLIKLSDYGIRQGADASHAIHEAISRLSGTGGKLVIDGTYRAGLVSISGENFEIEGSAGRLIDTRLAFAPGSVGITVRNLQIVETRGTSESYLFDISGSKITFENVTCEKRPMAGGYQGYLRHTSRDCNFTGIRLRGSNGIFVSGRNHLFDGFDLRSTMRHDMGGDDAFAIKGAGTETSDITIRNGSVTGFSAAISIGSEVGSNPDHPGSGGVRRVTMDNVVADRCQMVCFIKPGALDYDWRNGLVEDIALSNVSLSDPAGFMFARGIVLSADRGATIRNVTARNVRIDARSRTQGVMPTSAIDLFIRSQGAPATITNVDLAVFFDGRGARGYPVDFILRAEKSNALHGRMNNVSVDVEGAESRIAGIYVGPGLDDSIYIRRAVLNDVAVAPPSSLGAAGLWLDSRTRLGDVRVDAVAAPRRGGRFAN